MVEIEHRLAPHKRLIELSSQTPIPSWDDLRNPEKSEVKNSLNTEQNGLCAYCERHLRFDHGRIDHIACQDGSPQKRFEYRNLCHSCSGRYTSEDGESNSLSCDQYKENNSLGPIEPRPGVNKMISFDAVTGELEANESLSFQLKKDVEVALHTLGLNNSARLKDDRKTFWEELSNILEENGNPLDLLDPHNEYYWTMKEYFSPQP